MTHQTIEAMARAICDAAFPVNPDAMVELTNAETGEKTSIPAWQLYGLEPAQAAARALLEAEPSDAEVMAAGLAFYGSSWAVMCSEEESKKAFCRSVTRTLKAARTVQMKEMGI